MGAALLSNYRVLVVPGLSNSGEEHWQSRWQRLYPGFERVNQQDWETPNLQAWRANVDRVRQEDRRPTLIAAHSFGSLASALSVAEDPLGVEGLLLVAPADPDKFGLAARLPQGPLPCPSIVIASSTDPWMDIGKAREWAARWGSRFIDIGERGHINSESGLGDWIFGQQQLQLLAETAHNGSPLSV
ncbi:RBBP9/YdeN family alpha/beta hydrolase [Massilia endophytica]|uniref:RBBP9/YdeN family alpha/beta hydrolase n=1 Tax=Massilia endophytica TaxID=2899220 RepID=UPI001E3F4FF1|nr:alpha/beta hydrolase [Massilia endophytica]UGQ45291.1 alpha/beta hydrolase [Massilia endophytica]